MHLQPIFHAAWRQGLALVKVSSDGGALLLREVDRKINLLGRVAGSFVGGRSPSLVKHQLAQMLAQRIFALALGYEDLCDHEQLRSDPLLALLSGKSELDKPLAGNITLNRLELVGRTGRYHKISYSTESLDRLLGDLYLESHRSAPEQVVLDLDATDIPLYGHQPERFFHGYYGSYCYLPLYIFAGDQLLCARLRAANQDAAAGAVEEVSRIVAQLRQRWPQTRMVLRADSGFCREELMGWCEANKVDYLFGLARNQRLQKIIGAQMQQARVVHQSTGKAARVFTGFAYTTRHSWSRARRVVAKAEYLDKGENPASRGHFADSGAVARPGTLREVLLRPRRNGKPHQGTDVPVRRSAINRRDEGQSVAPLLLCASLHADGGAAPAGPARHRVGPGSGRYHPSQAVQDRCHRAHQRAPHYASAQLGLSLERPLRSSLPRLALLKPAAGGQLHFHLGPSHRHGGAMQKTTLLILKHLITRQKLLRRLTPSCKNTATGSPQSQTSREFSDGEKCGLACRESLRTFTFHHRRVPHISLVFREMWDTADLNFFCPSGFQELPV